MKIYYVDAENVGANWLEELKASILDRVFVFTNSPGVKASCRNALMTCISDYPTGPNQADFCIIAHLSNVLAHISKTEKKAIEFCLCSKDQSLWKAFEYQCTLAGVQSSASHIETQETKNTNVVPFEGNHTTQILKCMSQPISSNDLQKQLKMSQPEFTTAFNQLIRENKIKRQSKSKKLWLRVGGG